MNFKVVSVLLLGAIVLAGVLLTERNEAQTARSVGKSLPPQTQKKDVIAPENAGDIEGTVRFVGEPIPKSTIVPVGDDRAHCGRERSKEDFVIDSQSRGIRYVIVRLTGEKLARWKGARPGHLLLDNKDCRFEPHAATLTVGSTLEMKNSDDVLHTVHAYFSASFNFALPKKSKNVKKTLSVPGLVQLRCDKHGWMNAFIRVDRHPFHAVTDALGRFKITGVPAGNYMLEAWHERFGSKKVEVSVQEKQTIGVDLTYTQSETLKRRKDDGSE